MIYEKKYVLMDGSLYFDEYLTQLTPIIDHLSANVITVVYMQIMRITFDKINIGISQLHFSPKCEDILLAYGLIINDDVKNQLCEIINKYYFSIISPLLHDLDKLGLLSNGYLHNHVFLDHDSPQNFILLMRIT